MNVLQNMGGSDHVELFIHRELFDYPLPHVHTCCYGGSTCLRIHIQTCHAPASLFCSQQEHAVATADIQQCAGPPRQVPEKKVQLKPQRHQPEQEPGACGTRRLSRSGKPAIQVSIHQPPSQRTAIVGRMNRLCIAMGVVIGVGLANGFARGPDGEINRAAPLTVAGGPLSGNALKVIPQSFQEPLWPRRGIADGAYADVLYFVLNPTNCRRASLLLLHLPIRHQGSRPIRPATPCQRPLPIRFRCSARLGSKTPQTVAVSIILITAQNFQTAGTWPALSSHTVLRNK